MDIKKIFSSLILLLTFVSVNQWSTFPIGNLWLEWFIKFIIIFLIFKYKKTLFQSRKNFTFLSIYLFWTLFCILRGLFIAENYIEYKQLINNGIPLFIPILLWLFYRPDITQYIYKYWYKWGIIAFFVFFLWVAGPTQFYLSPFLILMCFFPLFRKREAIIIFFMGIIYSLIMAGDNRSQLIKGCIALTIGCCIYYADKIPLKLVKMGHYLCYFSSIILFAVILSDASGLILGKMSENDALYNFRNREKNEKDTRSLIYYDVYRSAVTHDYWLYGRTPARGNEMRISTYLYEWAYRDNTMFNKNERGRNEMLHANIFTWEGLIGLILYALLYMRASYLAVYKSANRYLPYLGCYIAFRWSYGWIEDTNCFLISDIALWSMITICYSPLYRNMSNIEFKNWIRKLI